ncbi:MAG: hypothetical protein ACSHX9_05370 [Luteolibacter sp.]
MLQSTGYFEPTSFASEAAFTSPSPKVVVDFNSSLILAIDSKGKTIFSSDIPATGESLSDAIAAALGNF